MAEFKAAQDSVVTMLTKIESKLSRIEQREAEAEDEGSVEEKDQEPLTGQLIGPPLELALPSTSTTVLSSATNSVSSPAFNLPPCLSPISEKSIPSSPPLVVDGKGHVRTEAPPTILVTAHLPHPLVATKGASAGTSVGTPLGIGQLKLEGPARYSSGRKPSVCVWLVEVERWMHLMRYLPDQLGGYSGNLA